jgi:hypothetical protein
MKISVSHTITDRSMMFCSSRMFLGQEVRLEEMQSHVVDTPDVLAPVTRLQF